MHGMHVVDNMMGNSYKSKSEAKKYLAEHGQQIVPASLQIICEHM